MPRQEKAITTMRRYSITLTGVYFLLLIGVALGYRLIYEIPKEKQFVAQYQTQELGSIETGFAFFSRKTELLLEDWAYWDDTYEFVQNPDDHPNYLRSNITEDSYRTLGLMGIQYLDKGLNVVFEQGFDLDADAYIDFSDLGIATKSRLRRLGRGDGSEEFFLSNTWMRTSKGPAQVAISTISNSVYDQPPEGYLVFIRLVREEALEELASVTRINTWFEETEANSSAVPLSMPVSVATIQETRTRWLVDTVNGEPVAALGIEHNTNYSGHLVTTGTLLLIGAMGIIPIISFCMLDSRLVVPLEQNTKRIQNMVNSDQLILLDTPFALKELEDMRLAFNKAVDWVEQQQEQLRQLSNTDSLTGIANRRGFDLFVDRASRQARRQGTPMMWVVLDLDHFKQFNDTQGHPAGDDVLRKVGAALANLTQRATDFCARTGGEEFAVILVGADEDKARKRVENIRAKIESLQIPHPGSSTATVVTASVGAIWIDDMSEIPLECGDADLFERADKALYRAKATGRNRCQIETLSLLKGGQTHKLRGQFYRCSAPQQTQKINGSTDNGRRQD